MNDNVMQISGSKFAWFQFGTVTILAVFGMFYYYYMSTYPDDLISAFFELFDPGDESSIQTVFSTFNLGLAGVLAFIIHRDAKRRRDALALGWLMLSVMLCLLALDEGAQLHERAGARFLYFSGLDLPMIANHPWLLAGAFITVIVAPIFIPFLLGLDSKTRLLFVLSGVIFLTGALGFEFVGAWMMHEYGFEKADLIYLTRRVFEEGFEMYGIALMNCTLFSVIRANDIVVRLMPQKTAAA